MSDTIKEFDRVRGRSLWRRLRAFVRFAFRWADAGMPDPIDMTLTCDDDSVEYVFVGFVLRKNTRRPIAVVHEQGAS